MIYPNFLEKGNCIGVPAPSDGAYDEKSINKFKTAKLKLENLGYKIIISKNLWKSEKCRSADAKTRGTEINEMFERNEINFVICAAGGEFLVECLPYINFSKITKNPKFVQGFSDASTLLFVLTTKYDIASIYSHNFKRFGMEEYHYSIENNLKIMEGTNIVQKSFELYESGDDEGIVLESSSYNLDKKVYWKIINSNSCQISGRMIGGCIENISVLSGTKYDGTKKFLEKYKTDGIIWYFDNFDISKEELIRVLWKFNELGYFKYTTGIIFGRPAFDNTCLGYTMDKALKDSVISKLNIPIIYDACISHKSPTLTIINGAKYNIEVNEGKAKLKCNLN